MLEKNDNFKQRRITDMFSACSKPTISDIEDIVVGKSPSTTITTNNNNNKRKRSNENNEFNEEELNQSWRDILGNPPAYGSTYVSYSNL